MPPRRPDRPFKNSKDSSPVGNKQREVLEREARIKQELERTRKFIEEAPKKKAEVEQKRREELLQRAGRVGRIDGPTDRRYDSVIATPRQRPLRKERNHDRVLFLFLLIAFGFVICYAWRILMHG